MPKVTGQPTFNATSLAVDPNVVLFREVAKLINNTITSRSQFWNNLLRTDARRDIYAECGYPEANPVATDYYRMWERDPIGGRVVEMMPKECWQVTPSVYESEDGEEATEFERAWDALGASIRSEQSWYKEEDGNGVWDYLQRADILSGIGRYGVILLGFNDLKDGDSLAKPVSLLSPRNIDVVTGNLVSPKKRTKLNYIRVFPENLAAITEVETDLKSKRHGQPTMYSITFNDPESNNPEGTVDLDVHWTRVIHIAESLVSDEVYGIPRMQVVWERLLDLRKIYGANAEGYWKACFTILTAETHPSLGGDVEVDEEKMKDLFEKMMNGLQRTAVLEGFTLKSTAPTVVDPTPHIDKHIEAICIKLGSPIPVFKGYEIGEQASENNGIQWGRRVANRQKLHCSARIIIPFIDRLIATGVLPEPGEGWCCAWPDIEATTESDKAQVAYTTMQTLALYITSGANQFMTFFVFLTTVMKMDDETAQNTIDTAKAAADEFDHISPEDPTLGNLPEPTPGFDEEGFPYPKPAPVPAPTVKAKKPKKAKASSGA